MQQVITPNPNIPCMPGWCLMYVRQAAGLPARYATATEAWEKSTSQHRDRNFPAGMWTPVWYGLDREPAGHVVWLAPDGSVYSTSDNSTTPHHHPDLADLEAFYAAWGWPLTYRGWTEDVAGFPVMVPGGIAPQADSITPIPEEYNVADIDQKLTDIWAAANAGRQEATNAKVAAQEASARAGTAASESTNAKLAARDSAAGVARVEAALAALPAQVAAVVLGTRLDAPDGSGKAFTVAEYLTYGWWYAMQAKDAPAGGPAAIDAATLTKAIEASAAAVAAQLTITTKGN